MANKNTNPGIGKAAVPGVMNNPDTSRARTRTRGMSYGDINNIPLVVIPRACAHAREENAKPLACSLWMTRRLRKARAESQRLLTIGASNKLAPILEKNRIDV